MGDVFMAFIVMFFLVVVCLAILCIPIMIANARGICGSEKTAIIVLSWLGIFFGITWFVTLILSLVWHSDCVDGKDNLDRLEKLSKLYKEKAITKEEYERMKEKLLR